jgi:hypothetical protein
MRVETIKAGIDGSKFRLSNLYSKLFSIRKVFSLEAFVWTVSLFYLAFVYDPDTAHFPICPLSNLGFDFCPGCGLGKSISLIFNGDFLNSFKTHPLGLFAILIISHRLITLIKINGRKYD